VIPDAKSIPDWRLHDLRRTATTVMADRLHVLPHIVEAVLVQSGPLRGGGAGSVGGPLGRDHRLVIASDRRVVLKARSY
jgi:hypothetical protein